MGVGSPGGGAAGTLLEPPFSYIFSCLKAWSNAGCPSYLTSAVWPGRVASCPGRRDGPHSLHNWWWTQAPPPLGDLFVHL